MRFITCLLITFLYSEFAYSTLYSCEVFKDKQKIATLTGALNNSNLSSNQQADPNTALAFLLCQEAGLKPVNVMIDVPGIRTGVTKSQLLPNPACTLQCTPL